MKISLLRLILIVSLFSIDVSGEQDLSNKNQKNENQDYNRLNIEIVEDFKKRISKIDSYVAYFVQKEVDKPEFHGVIFFKKNIGIRFNYFEPHPFLLTITKKNAYLYDYEMENLSIINSSESPIYFLIDNNWKFSENIKIINATKDTRFYNIKLFHDNTETTIDIVFDYLENQIKFITIIDHQGQNVAISFDKKINIENLDMKIDDKIFRIKNPKIYGKPQRLNRNEIQKLYIKK